MTSLRETSSEADPIQQSVDPSADIRAPKGAYHALTATIMLLWVYGWLPSFVSLGTVGRAYISGLASTSEAESTAAVMVSDTLAYGIIGALLVCLLLARPMYATARPGAVAILLLAWAILYVFHGEIGLRSIMFPLLAIALMAIRPNPQFLYRSFAWMGVLTAGISLTMVMITDLAFMPDTWSNADKALIGNEILAGPYSHSNALGLALALTVPFVAQWFRGYSRLFAVTLVAIALVWSASRISIAVAVFALVISLIVLTKSASVIRNIMIASVMTLTAALVTLPAVTTDPEFLTARGKIWIESLSRANEHTFGLGPNAFRTINELTNSIDYLSTTGHNMYVTILIAGGWPTVTLFAILLLLATCRSGRAFRVDRYRLTFLAVLLAVGMAEDPLRALRVGPHSFVIFPMLVLMVTYVSKEHQRAHDSQALLEIARARP